MGMGIREEEREMDECTRMGVMRRHSEYVGNTFMAEGDET